MSVRKAAFWLGLMVGAGIGYIVGISMPEEKQKRLREELVKRGEDVVEKAREVGEERARELSEEARRRAEEMAAKAKERIPEVVPFAEHIKPNSGTEPTEANV